ncbi:MULTISPECIES: TlpA family protein disulfide reductase [Bacillus]|jgi:peroxiredoxin|uniref:TlpA family protein disulfide reductase n=1 Tax=Bacillus TaxID=1386 RepID=UPI00081FB9B5|nr:MULTISPECIES: TlpA disulfide reductase family protein [Bacillus]AOC56624.1 thiol:disulfide interchange protein [Bacillus pumilus]MBR0585998.1 TlpA family protein disulfide reductase [Bacillus pumilus DW2J2]MBR0616774.1 TlpA family protein disulfide reductase [Bacillus pumilus]MBR0619211.1 TlpA family protein disulfide reductase [Bacillus pumilus]MBR0623545.1 TlpA family protein disulfide reductase [Bacillus pumilus]
MWKKGMASAVLLVLIGLLVWNLLEPKEPAIGLEKGDQAPDFELKTLDGQTASLSDYQGKKVLVNFWATWCKPCRTEMPDLNAIRSEYDQVEVLAVNLTTTEKSVDHVAAFADELKLSFPILLDQKGIQARYQVLSYPTTYILDEKGRIVSVKHQMLTKKEIEQELGL